MTQNKFLDTLQKRQKTVPVSVGGIQVGGGAPVVVQSMTNTDTADIEASVRQVIALANAGSEIVRLTVDRDESAAAIPHIKEKIKAQGVDVPLVGDFHYIGHELLEKHPACAEALDKYRINPGNVGFGKKKDVQFNSMIETALKYDKPVRIGVNWGSLDQELATRLMEENAKLPEPKTATEVTHEALVQSALLSAQQAENLGMGRDKIILSTKVSHVQDLIAVYTMLAERSNYALHLGLTEAGMGSKGIVASAAALAVVLEQGIGDTIRISITPEPGEARTKEVKVAQELLQSMSLRAFTPIVSSCPGCGRTTSTTYQTLAKTVQEYLQEQMPVWRQQYPGVESLKVAVMGCIVNGPGESKHADIGISLPGTGENPAAAVFIDGEKFTTLRGDDVGEKFKAIVVGYVEKRYSLNKAASQMLLDKLLIASHNKGKVKQIQQLLEPLGIQVISAAEIDVPDVEETGTTFSENAILKAEAACAHTGLPCLADDSGLEVDALGGKPGVYSKRWAFETGETLTYQRLLNELKGLPNTQRQAKFICVLALAIPNQKTELFEGFCQGTIATEARGEGGFGYDPVFVPTGKERTWAQMNDAERAETSHRGHALRKFQEFLTNK